MLEWLTVADDRTGALEVAGEMAGSLGPVTVTVGMPPRDVGAAVVDIGSRHTSASVAADRAVRAAGVPARHRAHKIDSLLRGNWAHELVSVQRASAARMLIVPALPRLGRVCCGGVVHVDGVPVGGRDARRAASSPRPAEHLVGAGARDVVELADAAALRDWMTGSGGRFAVCDAMTDEDLAALAEAWTEADTSDTVAETGSERCFAGTAGSIAAAVAAVAAVAASATTGAGAAAVAASSGDPPMLTGDVLVVCGSLHPMARDQVDALRSVAGVEVLLSPPADGASVAPAAAERVAAGLGRAARDLMAARTFGVLVVLGGDTAAAVLGDAPMVVGGTLVPGVPWLQLADGSGPLVVTKAGGFGHPTTLVELLDGRSPTEER